MQNEKPKDTEPDGTGPRIADAGAKALDIALGMASLTVEAAEYAARYITEKAPEWIANLEERGRPVREQLSEVTKGYTKPLPVETGADEISALERRIRELETQVSTGTEAEVTHTAGVMAPLVPAGAPSDESAPIMPPISFVAPDIDEDDDPAEGTGDAKGGTTPE